jgi:hypothetical protein
VANLISWSENNEQTILAFEWSLFKTELIQQKPYAQQNKLFAFIESFQRYIPSDKSIVLTKDVNKHD